MAGGGDYPNNNNNNNNNNAPSAPPLNEGNYLLQLLQRPSPPHHQHAPPPSAPSQSRSFPHDPAVAAVGPSIPFPPFSSPANQDLLYRPRALSSPWPHSPSSSFGPHSFVPAGFPHNPNPNSGWSSPPSQPIPQFVPPGFTNLHRDQASSSEEARKIVTLSSNEAPFSANQNDCGLVFGSLTREVATLKGTDSILPEGAIPGSSLLTAMHMKSLNDKSSPQGEFHNYFDCNRHPRADFDSFRINDQRSKNVNFGVSGRQAPQEVTQPPSTFTSGPKGGGGYRRHGNRSYFENNVDRRRNHAAELNHWVFTSSDKQLSSDRGMFGSPSGKRLVYQPDRPGLPAGISLPYVSASEVDEFPLELQDEADEVDNDEDVRHVARELIRRGDEHVEGETNDLAEQLLASLGLGEDSRGKLYRKKRRDKDYRSDERGKRLLGQRMRNLKRMMQCRTDIDKLNIDFVAIYKSLIPADEEKQKQKQVVMLLEKLITKEWHNAQLYVYGSCANSFGFSKSDIDVCLVIEDTNINKTEVILKLADILQSGNLQNVQPLTHARVPIVKLVDPSTGIACDICINNVLAVVNTKLLRDYAQIDERLQQLAFIVKHWAKLRRVNETYRGTLSSYAYVLMCIHFLQQRKPAILPCLQGMKATYSATVDGIEYSYFDQVETLRGFGSQNEESIAQLVWAFFHYWAYRHDYTNDVISVRTGCMLSKRAIGWTTRVGNDRHLICIEDPFELSHDLGRVVDKYSIKVLREEFERAADIMQHDLDPCVKLFEPYVPSNLNSGQE